MPGTKIICKRCGSSKPPVQKFFAKTCSECNAVVERTPTEEGQKFLDARRAELKGA